MVSPDVDAAAAPVDFSARLAALQRHFVGGLPARWAAIQQAAPGAAQQAELHRLAGAAGSFGFADLGEAARVAERCSEVDMPAALSQVLLLISIKAD